MYTTENDVCLDSSERMTLALHEQVEQLKFATVPRLVSYADLKKSHGERMPYNVHFYSQPPQPSFHTVDFCEPELLPLPNALPDTGSLICAMDSHRTVEEEESSCSSIGTMICDDDAGSSPSLSIVHLEPNDGMLTTHITSLDRLLQPTRSNFWKAIKTGIKIDWTGAPADDHASGTIIKDKNMDTTWVPDFVLSASNAAHAIKPVICIHQDPDTHSKLPALTMQVWQKRSLYLAEGRLYHNWVNIELHLGVETGNASSPVVTSLSRVVRPVALSYPLVEHFSVASDGDKSMTRDADYVERARINVSIKNFLLETWRLAKSGSGADKLWDGLSLLSSWSTVLALLRRNKSRFIVRAFLKRRGCISIKSDSPIWISDPFTFCQDAFKGQAYSHDSYLCAQYALSRNADCWMTQVSLYAEIFFESTARLRHRTLDTLAESNSPEQCQVITFNAMFNFLQHLLVQLRPSSYKPHYLCPGQLWQFMLESSIVIPNYTVVTCTENPNTVQPYNTITFDYKYSITRAEANHLQLDRSVCESLHQSINNRMCFVDRVTFYRTVYPFVKLLWTLNQDDTLIINRVWSNGYVSLASPPMVQLLDERSKFWFALEPCPPYVIPAADIRVSVKNTHGTKKRAASEMTWMDSHAIPCSSIADMYIMEKSSEFQPTLSLWCGELGNVAISSTADESLKRLLLDLRLEVFYGVDDIQKIVKRSLVSMLL